MTTYDVNTSAGPSSHTGRTRSIFATLLAKVHAWNDARITRQTLNALDDRELDDIGLSRGDIERIVRKG